MDEVGLIPLLAVIISVNHGFVHICMCHRLSYHSECSTKCVIQCSHYVCVTRLLHKEAKGDGGGVTCQANDQVQDCVSIFVSLKKTMDISQDTTRFFLS